VYLRVPSGQVFIGSGEDTTGGGLEPDGSDVNRGQFITLDKGTYCMRYKGEAGIIHLAFSPSTTCCNHLTDAIRLPMPHCRPATEPSGDPPHTLSGSPKNT